MGEIKKLLSHRQLPDRELHNSRLFIDLSENVHIHFRELRLMFGVDEFFEFINVITDSQREIKKYLSKHKTYKEQKIFDGLFVAGGLEQQTSPLTKSPKPNESKYFNNRLQIELQEEKVIDSIHIHYRDYRLVMNFETFRELSLGMKDGLESLDQYLSNNKYNQEEHEFRNIVVQKKWKNRKVRLSNRIKRKLQIFLGKFY